jgi:flagellar FliL protein
MAEESVQAPVETAPAPKKPGIMTVVKAAAIVSIIVLLQVTAAAFLIPSPEQTRQAAEKLAHASHGTEPAGAEHEAAEGEEGGHHAGDGGGEAHETREVKLGSFHVVSFNPKTGTSLSIDFELFGAVLADEEAEFSHLFTAHEKRISEQITIAVRGMEAADLTDPGLGLIKRIILEKTNRALGKPLIREAIISEFSFMER